MNEYIIFEADDSSHAELAESIVRQSDFARSLKEGVEPYDNKHRITLDAWDDGERGFYTMMQSRVYYVFKEMAARLESNHEKP